MKMTNKYTAEQIDACILCYKSGDLNYCRQGIVDLLTDYAAHLRERESAKAAATDGWPEYVMLRDTGLHDDSGGLGQHIYTTAGAGYEKRKYILEAVAPMLASARVPNLENALRMVVAANAMLSEIEDSKTLYEGSPLHSTRCLLAWDNLNTAIANAKQVLAAAPKPETEE